MEIRRGRWRRDRKKRGVGEVKRQKVRWRGNREKEEIWRKRQRDGETEGENGRSGRMDGGQIYSSVCPPFSSNVLERILLQNLNLSSFS